DARLRQEMPTFAPAAASISAVARPTPREPPVTNAFFPLRSIPSMPSGPHPLATQVALVLPLGGQDFLQHSSGLRVQITGEERLIARNLLALPAPRFVFPPRQPQGWRRRARVAHVLAQLEEPRRDP